MTRLLPALFPLAFAFPSLLHADQPLTKAAPAADGHYGVEVLTDLAYRDDKDADAERNKLDLYLPKGAKDFPVMMFVHGGAWMSGDKGLYNSLGKQFAANGVGTAIINYRLSGKDSTVKHPDHIQDVAKAFAWVHTNIAKYGGRADRIFISGHSAGAHLVALLATDDTYLKAEKLSLDDIHGVMALSGVYTIVPLVPIFTRPFGKDEEVCKAASPINHVTGKHPPFLIAYGDVDFPFCDKMSDQFCSKLKDCKCEAATMKVSDRNHFTIIFKVAMDEKDVCTKAMYDFIGKHSEWKAPVKK
jgi:arylformamidase